VQFNLRQGDLAHWSTASHSWVIEGGAYRIWVGDSSNPSNLPLTTSMQVPAAALGANSGPAGT
jgi:hypothetical protein